MRYVAFGPLASRQSTPQRRTECTSTLRLGQEPTNNCPASGVTGFSGRAAGACHAQRRETWQMWVAPPQNAVVHPSPLPSVSLWPAPIFAV